MNFTLKMTRVKRFDQRAARNRDRVRKYRTWRKLKADHDKYIHDQIYNAGDVRIGRIPEEIFEHDSQHGNSKIDKANEITDKLKYWAMHHRITQTALNDILSILKFAGLEFLPKDSRTLMATPVKVPIGVLSNGKIWYNGVQKCLEEVLGRISANMSITLGCFQ